MAIPGSGALRISDINTELCRTSTTANSSLAGGSTPNYTSLFGLGYQYGSLNQTAPHSMSEFYNYCSIIRNGLVFAFDAGNCISYPGSGTVWKDFNGSTICSTTTGTIPYTSAGGQSYFSYNASSNACFVGTTCLKSQISDAITVISVAKPTRLDCRLYIMSKYQYPTVPYGYVFEVGTVGGLWTNSMRFWVSCFGTRSTDVRGTVSLSNTTTYMFTFQYRQSDCQRCMFYNTTAMPYTEANPNYGDVGSNWAQGDNPFSIGTDTVNLSIGQQYNLLVYNRYLSFSEIQQTYNALKTRFGL